jgi:hypothetical protein
MPGKKTCYFKSSFLTYFFFDCDGSGGIFLGEKTCNASASRFHVGNLQKKINTFKKKKKKLTQTYTQIQNEIPTFSFFQSIHIDHLF